MAASLGVRLADVDNCRERVESDMESLRCAIHKLKIEADAVSHQADKLQAVLDLLRERSKA